VAADVLAVLGMNGADGTTTRRRSERRGGAHRASRRRATERRGSVPWVLGGLALVWVFLGAVLQLARQEGVAMVDTMWAEDGVIWLGQAVEEGSVEALLEPYQGYAHLLPRLLGAVGSAMSMSFAAAFFSITAVLIVSSLSLYVFRASSVAFPSVGDRLVITAFVVVVPAAIWEVTGNVTNLQWHLLFPCFWALLYEPRNRADVAAGSVVAGVTALSAPTSLLYVPLAAILFVQRGSAAFRVVAGVFLGCAALQVLVALGQGSPFAAETNPLELPGLFGLRVGGSLLLGDRLLLAAWPRWGWTIAIAAWAPLIAIGVCGLFRSPTRGRRVAALAALYSLAFFSVPVYIRGTSLLRPVEEVLKPHGSKWTVASILLLATAVLVVLRWEGAGPVGRVARLLFLALLVVGTASTYRVDNDRSPGPRWSAGLSEAAERCQRGAPAVGIPISPPGWVVRLSCQEIVESSVARATTSI
jgi:hypothetical protein